MHHRLFKNNEARVGEAHFSFEAMITSGFVASCRRPADRLGSAAPAFPGRASGSAGRPAGRDSGRPGSAAGRLDSASGLDCS